MSLGGKYVFATVMCIVLPMCILISCSSVLCVLMALGMFMFVKVMSSLIGVMSPLLVCALCLCVWWCSGLFLVFCIRTFRWIWRHLFRSSLKGHKLIHACVLCFGQRTVRLHGFYMMDRRHMGSRYTLICATISGRVPR